MNQKKTPNFVPMPLSTPESTMTINLAGEGVEGRGVRSDKGGVGVGLLGAPAALRFALRARR
jgi:hypothetical protein